jgi:hypothetical protein
MIADTLLVADGTSYRHQIHDGAGRAAVHVARVLGARMTTASAAARDTAATLPQARIAKLPAAFFGAVMGLVGLGLAWRSAAHVFGVPALIGELILVLGAAAFVFLAAFYIAKILRAPAAVLAELMHPGQSSFFGTISISFVLLAARRCHGRARSPTCCGRSARPCRRC